MKWTENPRTVIFMVPESEKTKETLAAMMAQVWPKGGASLVPDDDAEWGATIERVVTELRAEGYRVMVRDRALRLIQVRATPRFVGDELWSLVKIFAVEPPAQEEKAAS